MGQDWSLVTFARQHSAAALCVDLRNIGTIEAVLARLDRREQHVDWRPCPNSDWRAIGAVLQMKNISPENSDCP